MSKIPLPHETWDLYPIGMNKWKTVDLWRKQITRYVDQNAINKISLCQRELVSWSSALHLLNYKIKGAAQRLGLTTLLWQLSLLNTKCNGLHLNVFFLYFLSFCIRWRKSPYLVPFVQLLLWYGHDAHCNISYEYNKSQKILIRKRTIWIFMALCVFPVWVSY